MALQVIGAGCGRTGTESLKKALEQLGFGRCYHMYELVKDGRKVVYWEQLYRKEIPDYENLFHGYQSAVDFPSFLYYKELMKAYPEAKVILTVRDAGKWYESASKTIFRKIPAFPLVIAKMLGVFSKRLWYLPKVEKFAKTAGLQGFYQGKTHDKQFITTIFNQWNEAVKAYVPADRLLVYEVKDGWKPLCEFLQVPIPDTPFPSSNSSDDFQKRIKTGRMIKGSKA